MAALEVAAGHAERKLQAAEAAAADAAQRLQEAEDAADRDLAAALEQHAAEEVALRQRLAAAEQAAKQAEAAAVAEARAHAAEQVAEQVGAATAGLQRRAADAEAAAEASAQQLAAQRGAVARAEAAAVEARSRVATLHAQLAQRCQMLSGSTAFGSQDCAPALSRSCSSEHCWVENDKRHVQCWSVWQLRQYVISLHREEVAADLKKELAATLGREANLESHLLKQTEEMAREATARKGAERAVEEVNFLPHGGRESTLRGWACLHRQQHLRSQQV